MTRICVVQLNDSVGNASENRLSKAMMPSVCHVSIFPERDMSDAVEEHD